MKKERRKKKEKGERQVCEQIASLEYEKWWEKHFD